MIFSRKPRAGRSSFDTWIAVIGIATCGFVILPFIVVLPVSLGPNRYLQFPPEGLSLVWYKAYFSDPDWWGPTLFSAKVALVTAVIATVLGTMSAYALQRALVPGRRIIDLLLLAPVIVPNIALALADYFVFAQMRLIGTLWGFVAAHVVLSIPFVTLTVTTALVRLDSDLELASMGMGASRFRAFFDVVLPLSLPGVVSGFLFSFITSFDESTISFFISGFDQKTLPRKMFEDIEQNVTPVLAAVSVLLCLLSVLIVLTAGWLQGARRADAARNTAQGAQE